MIKNPMKKLILLVLLLPILAWAQTVTDLSDPGSNGPVKRTALGVTAIATSSDLIGLWTGCSGTLSLGADGACHTGSAAFSAITAGTNTAAAMVVGAGASLRFGNGDPWLDVMAAGAICNGSTDDTAAINSALTTLYNQNGGTLTIPPGKVCKITGAILLPNDGGSPYPHQPPIRITSWGGSSSTETGATPLGGGELDLEYNATTAKIDTRGLGLLEIDHVLLRDRGSDCAAFVFTTNTNLMIHDVEFYGTTTTPNACNDGVVIGGTSTTVGGGPTAVSQGTSVIENNFFAKIQRMVFLQVDASGHKIVNNDYATNSGNTNHAVIEMTSNTAGPAGGNDVGNYIAGNGVEGIGTPKYFFWCLQNCSGNMIAFNQLGGSSPNTTSYRFEATGDYNIVIDGLDQNPLAQHFSDVDATNTYIDFAQSSPSYLRQPQIFTNVATPIQISTASNGTQAFDILNAIDNSETYNLLTTSGGLQTWSLNLKPAGGTTENLISCFRSSGTAKQCTFGASNDTTIALQAPSSSDMKLVATGAHNTFLCAGGINTCHSWASSDNKFHQDIATGTAPFAITSNTPVVNLSLSGVGSTLQRSESGVDTNVLTVTPAAVAGSYRIRFVLSLSAANAATLGWTATWTDSNGNAQTPTNLALYQTGVAAPALTFTTSAAGDYYGQADIDVNNAATAIIVKLTFTGTSFTGKVSANIERLQ